MPRAGGEADKLGNRYEAIWTVDRLLDLLAAKSGVLQPIMPLDSPVKVRPWELTVYPRSHIRR